MNKGHCNEQQQQQEWPPTWAPLLSHLGFEIQIDSIIKKIWKTITQITWSVQPEKKIDDGKKMYYSSQKV